MHSASAYDGGTTTKWSRSKDSDVFQVPEISGLATHPMGSQEQFHSIESPVIVH